MKKFSLIAIFFVLLLLIAGLSLYIVTPYLLTTRLLPGLAVDVTDADLDLQISRLTPFTLTGSATLGNTENPALSLPRFELHYDVGGLADGLARHLIIDGATIRLTVTDGVLGLKNVAFKPQEKESAGFSAQLPFAVTSLSLRQCRFVIEQPGQKSTDFTVSGQLTLTTEKQQSGVELVGAEAEVRFAGPLDTELMVNLDLSHDQPKLTIDGKLYNLHKLATLLSPASPLIMDGLAGYKAELLFSQNFNALSEVKAGITFDELLVDNGNLTLTSSVEQPLQFTIDGDTTRLNYQLSNLATSNPQTSLTSLGGHYQTSDGEISGTGTLQLEQAEKVVNISVDGRVVPKEQQLQIVLSGENQRIISDEGSIVLGPYKMTTDLERNETGFSMDQQLKIDTAALTGQDIELRNINGTAGYIAAENDKGQMATAKLSVTKVYYKKEDMAEIQASLTLKNGTLELAGTLKTHLVNPLELRFSGTSSKSLPLSLDYQLQPTLIDNNSLPSFAALPADFLIAANLKASGLLQVDEKGAPAGSLRVQLSEGSIDNSEKSIHLSGIATDLNFPELPMVRSKPSQLLSIDAIDIGKLKFTNGSIYYRIEDTDSLFIEKSRFGWCKGRVEGGSLRLSTNTSAISTTLYCDRLDFSELLSQVGISDTEGDGSLNGRLPLHISSKGMKFDDGFLFSTPGNSGIVRFNNTEMLRQGMPEVGQAAYLDYSLRALENFSYNWTKLTFNSKDEDLLISMQIDGKPANPLPYGYRNGQLVRMETGSGIQHPLRLDVNFHLPFAVMFKYGQNLQKIMENLQ